MNRTILFTAAGLLSAAMFGAGCEHDSLPTSSASHTHSSTSDPIHSTGTAGVGADRGTGTTASGVTTGNVTTGADATARTPSADAAAPTASRIEDRSGEIDRPNTLAAGRIDEVAADATSDAKSADTTVGVGPAGIDRQSTLTPAGDASERVAADTAADAAPEATAADTTVGAGPAGIDQRNAEAAVADTDAEIANAASDATTADTTVGAGPGGITQNDTADADAVEAADKDAHDMKEAVAIAHVVPAAAAAKDAQVTGTVGFIPDGEHGLKVLVHLKGLKPNGKHGFHIHEIGDVSAPDLKSAGGHFNPDMKKHGGPDAEQRHGGDLGNITADADGNAKAVIMAHGVSIDGEKDGIVGRSVIIHAMADDLKTDPSGNSGDRIAGGKIEKVEARKAAADAIDDGAAQPAADQQPADESAPADEPAGANDAELNK